MSLDFFSSCNEPQVPMKLFQAQNINAYPDSLEVVEGAEVTSEEKDELVKVCFCQIK